MHALKSVQSDLRWSQVHSEFQNTFRLEFIPSEEKEKRKKQEPLVK